MHGIFLFSTVLSNLFYIKDIHIVHKIKKIAEIIKINPFKSLGALGEKFFNLNIKVSCT